MKAASKFLSAASAVALSAGMVVTGTVVVELASVSAAAAATVSSIEVRGNRRIDADTIRGTINIKPGRPFTNVDIDEGVKKLFATGLFSDVRINQRGSALVVEVDEFSVVNQVLFQGNKKIKDADLGQGVQLKPRGSFSSATMEADAEAIRQAYRQIGRNDATVNAKTVDLGDNRVNVVFEINEGGRTKVASINFVGNNAYGDGRLREILSIKKSNPLSFAFRNDIYDEERLRADEEALRRFYYNHGYADFQVISSSAELDEGQNAYSITITVDEGERYTFGDVTIENSVQGIDAEAMRSSLETRAGAIYSAKDVEDSLIALTERVAGLGYAFAQVTPRGDRNFENRTISVTYLIDQGPRTYVERIEIRGNTRTRDYVIRREFDVSEGDAFNQVLIQRAKKRLEALDYFTSVNISTAPGAEADQIVLVVDVVEKSTGEFSIGAGYSTGGESAGASVEGSISERNFLGRGQFIRFSAGVGQNSRDFTLSFTEPYFLGRRLAAGFDVFRKTRTYSKYTSEVTGATVRMGLPITENLSTTLAYNYSQEQYNYADSCDRNGDGIADVNVPYDTNEDGVNDAVNTCGIAQAIQDVVGSPWRKSSITAGLTFNTIDDMKNPHNGFFVQGSTEFAGIGGDANFIKFTGRASYYHTLLEEQDVVGILTGGAGHIVSTRDGGLRVFDLFQSSDRIIRGFAFNGIGPVDSATGDHLGGTTYFHASAEAQFPFPVVPPSFGLRAAVFADAATLFGNNLTGATSTGSEWRASVGAGLIWASPFGPLRVDYAVPVLKESTDTVQNFNFGISTRF